jgi:hypothetical protein
VQSLSFVVYAVRATFGWSAEGGVIRSLGHPGVSPIVQGGFQLALSSIA